MGRKEEEAGRKEQVRFGTKAGMSRKTKEMPVCHRPIKVLRYPDQRGGAAVKKSASRFEISDRGPGRQGISDGDDNQSKQTQPV
jgi:hypothetical protein